MQQGNQNTAAGSAYGVTQSDSAAIDIQLGGIEFQIMADSQGLRGKGLVGLDEVHISNLHIQLLHQLINSGNGTDLLGAVRAQMGLNV